MRIWVVDDQHEVREGVSKLLERCLTGARVTGMFGLGGDAVKAAEEGQAFEVALIDLCLPDIPGEDVVRQLRSFRPQDAIVAFTVRFDDQAIFSALRAGASGYVTKDASEQAVVEAVQSAAAGAAPFSPAISLSVARSFWGSPPQARGSQQAPRSASLTPRERQVLDLVCTGASYQEIGHALGVSLGTIQTHIKSIYTKLGVANKAEAMRWLLGSVLD